MKALKFTRRRVLAAALAALMILGVSLPAGAADIAPTCDETYYATLDYYGGLTQSSVVKSVRTYGNPVLTDFGAYDQVTNLTDNREATLAGGRVTFDLSGDVPDKFYFEGKTSQPYTDFPWALSLSYTLNGVPTPAEELAGRSGLVEITLDAVPNPSAPEYSRNNLVLTAMSMFNGDDILSLEAPGAQVQLVGNLYCVLYMVMPGEEQHFTIRVGSEDFSYTGMVFLAVPATLDQLEQIADLREAKEKMEDSYDAIQDSMDVILDSLDGMSGSLNATANGLDQLNRARDTISQGKGQVYDSLDMALDAAGPLTQAMEPMAGHLATAQQAMTDATALLNEMNDNLVGLKPEVENARQLLKDLQSDLDELQDLMDDLEDYPSQARRISKNLSDNFSQLGSSLNNLGRSMRSMRDDLSSLDSQLADVEGGSEVTIRLNGESLTVSQVESLVRQANGAYSQYEQALEAGALPEGTSFHDFLLAAGKSEEEADGIEALLAYSQTEEYQEKIKSAKQLNSLLKELDMTVGQLKSLVGTVNDKAGPILRQLESLCSALGGGSLSGDLEQLCHMLEELMEDVDDHSGALSSAAGTLKDSADLAIRVSGSVDTALDQVQALTDIMNTYEPEAQQALEDAKTFTDSASTSISALVDAARSAEGLMKNSGTDLDAGTKQALSGLAAALRKSTKGLSQTDTIRSAKDTIDALITDEWDSHTGGDNNILLMDAAARPISLTDSRNEGVTSIQYVMRSQEIKVEDIPSEEAAPAPKADSGTVWSRIVDMFKDIWNTITGWFSK